MTCLTALGSWYAMPLWLVIFLFVFFFLLGGLLVYVLLMWYLSKAFRW